MYDDEDDKSSSSSSDNEQGFFRSTPAVARPIFQSSPVAVRNDNIKVAIPSSDCSLVDRHHSFNSRQLIKRMEVSRGPSLELSHRYELDIILFGLLQLISIIISY
mmetsp:Transcript_5683/g.8795  ORF Transcript_5683/g.8795 Transcript_5683/m.8795 type:complete len:105 (+) Transcript_5683:385-699(+)